ncbi:hypothetical protein JYB87_06570 [Shewanella avicenniae]|uniref:Uncharacterized protein n=1 Tax=Shewanella avicenniae TaxID=2814294 RepID=A0ABX7QW74_9GAMM|nr:hypothetical protein [Shewanella avicenniae]QSX34883.1 hypothetical protein JYB87_06570 [Shewanella avicenniae]
MKSNLLIVTIFVAIAAAFISFTHNIDAQRVGMLPAIYITLVLGGFTLCNLPLQALFYFNGQYQHRRIVDTQVVIGVCVSLLGVIVAMTDYQSVAYLTFYLGAIVIGVALAILPFWLKQSAKAASKYAQVVLLLSGVIYGAISLLWWPVALFAAATALTALTALTASVQKTSPHPLVKFGAGVLFIAALLWSGYHCLTLWQQLSQS